MSNSIRREVWNFYIVKPGDSVSRIFRRAYGLSDAEFRRYLVPIAANNPHIKNLDRIRPGQFIDLSLQSNEVMLNHSADLQRAERMYHSLSEYERALIHAQPGLLATILGFIGSTSVNVVDAGFMSLENAVRNYAAAVERYGAELAKSYSSGAYGTLQTALRNRVLDHAPVRDTFSKIPEVIRRQVFANTKRLVTPFNFREATLIKDARRMLRLSPKSLSVYNPFSGALAEYSRVARMAKYGGTVTTWIIPTAIGISDSIQAYGTDQFGVTVSKSAGNVAGGALGTLAGYAVCNVFFAAPSAGTSLFWCGVVAGSAAGMGMGALGSTVGEFIYNSSSSTDRVSTFSKDQCFVQGKPCELP